MAEETSSGSVRITQAQIYEKLLEVQSVQIEIEAEEFATVSAFNDVVSKLESAIAELSAKVESLTASNIKHKEAMSKAIDLIEKVADLPSEEPLKAPVSTKKNDHFEALKKELRLLKEKMKPVYNFITEKEWMIESNKKETGQLG